MAERPHVMVLILNYNGRDLLDDSVSSYLENDYPNFEVTVIDNGSSDGSADYVKDKFPAAKVLRSEKNLFYSGGFNFGMKYAFDERKVDFVLITNNDVNVDKHVISAFVEAALEDESRGFVIGKVYYTEKPDTFQTVGKKYDAIMWNGGHIGHLEKDLGQYDEPAELAWCDDIYWLVSRKVYEATGGYDTEFAFQGEDFDWQARAQQKGFKIFYTPQAKLWHKESVTLGRTSAFKAYFDARNPLIVHMKHRSAEQFRKFFHIRFRELLRSCLFLFLHLKLKHLSATVRGVTSAIAWGFRNRKLTFRHFI